MLYLFLVTHWAYEGPREDPLLIVKNYLRVMLFCHNLEIHIKLLKFSSLAASQKRTEPPSPIKNIVIIYFLIKTSHAKNEHISY